MEWIARGWVVLMLAILGYLGVQFAKLFGVL